MKKTEVDGKRSAYTFAYLNSKSNIILLENIFSNPIQSPIFCFLYLHINITTCAFTKIHDNFHSNHQNVCFIAAI